jgi:hypothetical protein
VSADVYCQSMIIDTTNSRHIYTEQKEVERGQDTGETETVCARGRVAAR